MVEFTTVLGGGPEQELNKRRAAVWPLREQLDKGAGVW